MLILSAFFIVHEITRGGAEHAASPTWRSGRGAPGLLGFPSTRGRLCQRAPARPCGAGACWRGWGRAWRAGLLADRSQVGRERSHALVLAQSIPLIYSPSIYVPKERDAQAGRRIVRALAAMPGNVSSRATVTSTPSPVSAPFPTGRRSTMSCEEAFPGLCPFGATFACRWLHIVWRGYARPGSSYPPYPGTLPLAALLL